MRNLSANLFSFSDNAFTKRKFNIFFQVFKPLLETTSIESDEDMPSYLAEVDSPVKKEAVSRLFLIKDKSSHWLHSAVGFFQKSFYW